MNNIITNIFVYDQMLIPKVRDTLGIIPNNETIAETTGKLYMIHRAPIMLNLNDIVVNRGMRKVFGAILSFSEQDMDKVLYALDSYKGCSLSRIGVLHPCDYSHRATIKVYPIIFSNIHELENFSYKYDKGVDCYAYLGNPQNKDLIHNICVDRHHKLNGFYVKGFKNILKRSGYIE